METQKADDVVIAEAAAWIARLQGSSRTAAAEAAFREWLGDPIHRRAFARATDVWEAIPGAARFTQQDHESQRRSFALSRRRTLVGLAACLVLGAGLTWVMRSPTYTTAVGQQRTLALGDGTRVSLNTDSRLTIKYSNSARRVLLERGEALFTVAPETDRPFVVAAGEQQVRALGTTFIVRRQRSAVAVTLIEGRVEVISQPEHLPAKQILLSPGERVKLSASARVARDRPKMEAVAAWQHGEVLFDDVSLLDAAAEINRYGERHVALAEPALARLRVSGVFKTYDPEEFARAMARLHGLTVEQKESEIFLRR